MAYSAKRGYMPSDERDFAEKALPRLRKAGEEIYYLLNRGFPMTPTTRFVGDRYQFSDRQRLALARSISPRDMILSRRSREVSDIAGKTICIDGFNVIIGLEIAFSDSMLFRCMDGTVRDLAGLHGTYRLIQQSDLAIQALLASLDELKVQRAVIYLDKPVSNSGRLKQRIFEYEDGIHFDLDVRVEDAVDNILKSKPLVATADAKILDDCSEWFNLVKHITDTKIGNYPYVDLTPDE